MEQILSFYLRPREEFLVSIDLFSEGKDKFERVASPENVYLVYEYGVFCHVCPFRSTSMPSDQTSLAFLDSQVSKFLQADSKH